MPSRRTTIWRLGFASILILSALVYARSLAGAPVWDDNELLSGVGVGHSAAACFSQPFLAHYYRPLVSLSFYAENSLWRGAPLPYHITNILLHVLATAFLMAMLLALFQRRRVALAGGLLFAIQPVQVGATAWIGGRTDALCTMWMGLYVWLLVRAARSDGARFRWSMAGAVAAWVMAILTKEQMLPAILLAPLAFATLSPNATRRRTLWRSAPFAMAAVGFLAAGWLVGMPRPAAMTLSAAAQAAQVGRISCYYALALLAPTPQWLHTLSGGALEHAGIWPVLAGYAALIAVAAGFLRWRRTCPETAFLLAFLLLSLVLVLGVIPLPFLLVAPYRASAAGLAAAGVLGWFLASESPVRLTRPARRIPWRTAAYGIIAIWGAALTLWDVSQYLNEDHFWLATVRYDPYCTAGRFMYANRLITVGREPEAIPHLEGLMNDLFQSPDWRNPEVAASRIMMDGRLRQRIILAQGSRVDPAHWMTMLFSQLGFARLHRGDRTAAQAAFEAGVRLQPEDEFINTGLGLCAFQGGDAPAAERYARRALQAHPDKPDALACLGYALVKQKRWQEARSTFQRWAATQPRSVQARCVLAETNVRMGDSGAAVTALQEAMQIAPDREDIQKRIDQIRRSAAPRSLRTDRPASGRV